MRDRDVRQALHRKVLSAHRSDPSTLVLDELGLCEGEARVDIAVVNGYLHGYEIKSARDTLCRLPQQIRVYNLVLDRVTLVVAENHLEHAAALVPEWWGIKVARSGGRHAVHFRTLRRPRLNQGIVPIELAQLLWRQEALGVLESEGHARGVRGKSRQAVLERLVQVLDLRDLGQLVRRTLKARVGWRDTERPPSPCGDSSLP